MTPEELQNALAGLTGSDTLIRHGLTRRVLMTRGVVFLAERAQAHWLTDLIVSHQADPRVRSEPFQVWTLAVDERTRSAVATMTNGNSETPLTTQEIPCTDFPLPAITLWLMQEANTWVMLLPSEY
ncbi:DUF6876 family protein [Roseicella aerolata]|uniref:DUF6876 domain-containing protein n=1 Tax=Roseicella aerolata TaxID=2883479 RepID=A0A9X1IJ34_9PROT|nr:DUF6876 family protein [Roseicella aerolata]MCB4825552.1 hypothetical protein [Roseicella aerolata]